MGDITLRAQFNVISKRSLGLLVSGVGAIVSTGLLYARAISLDTQHGGGEWWLINCLAILAAVCTIVLLVMGAIAEVVGRRIRFRAATLIDLAGESRRSIRPLVSDIVTSLAAYPRMGLIGVLIVVISIGLVAGFTQIAGYGHHSRTEMISLSLALVGVMYGVLSYHVALRVDRTIRDSIESFSEFLQLASEILAEEIIEHPEFKDKEDDALLGLGYDLMLLMWVPSYSLTRDAERHGRKVDGLLRQISERKNCRTRLIACKDPFTLMTFFNDEKLRKFDSAAMELAAEKLKGVSPHKWMQTIETIPMLASRRTDRNVATIFESVHNLSQLLDRDIPGRPQWEPDIRENETLMRTHIQVVWTKRRAAIVFMPPVTGSKVNNGEGLVRGNDFRCSGFVTRDALMINMIGEIVSMRCNEGGQNAAGRADIGDGNSGLTIGTDRLRMVVKKDGDLLLQ